MYFFFNQGLTTSYENTVVKKIATNLSIIFLPLENDKRRKDPKKERKHLTPKHTKKESHYKKETSCRLVTSHIFSNILQFLLLFAKISLP